MDTIYSRIEKYNRREMDKRLFIDLLTGNITCNEEGNYRIEEQKWPSPPYQIVYIEIDGIKQKLHELQEEIVHEKIEKIENMIKESFGEEKVIVLSNNDNFQCILKRTKEKTITRVFREDSEKYFGKDRIYCSDRCFESRKFLPTFRKGLSGCKGCSRNCSVPGIQFKSTLYRRCRLLENHERNQ